MAGIQFVNNMINDMLEILSEIESGKLSEEDKNRKVIEMCTIFRYVRSYTDKETIDKIESYSK